MDLQELKWEDYLYPEKVQERIDELEDEKLDHIESQWTEGEEFPYQEELDTLYEFKDEVGETAWEDGEVMINDGHFETYAQELAKDTTDISDGDWLMGYIDWERVARDLKMDYTCATLDGVDFWFRCY